MQSLGMRRAAKRAEQLPGKHAQNQSKVLLLWSGLCAIHVLSSARDLNYVELGVLWTYWQPVFPPLFMLWLWGAAVRKFSQVSIDYDQCFAAKDRRYLLDGNDIQRIACVLLSLTMTAASIYCIAASRELFIFAEFMPLFLYCGLCAVVLMPAAMLHRPTRHFFAQTCVRVLMPFQEVSWADFLLADIFCSLSKSCADMASALCQSATGPVMQSLIHASYMPSAICEPTSPLMMLAPCLPYLIRFIQCIIVKRTTGSRTQVFNALKYMSAFPALILTALEHDAHLKDEEFTYRQWWLLAVGFNTAYSFYWDVEQDWDMPWFMAFTQRRAAYGAAGDLHAGGPSPQLGMGKRQLGGLLPSLRPDAVFSATWYAWALFSNLVLRCAWMHRLLGTLENHRRMALLLALAEVWRRYQWSFIRVETELRKVAARSASVMSLDALSLPPGTSIDRIAWEEVPSKPLTVEVMAHHKLGLGGKSGASSPTKSGLMSNTGSIQQRQPHAAGGSLQNSGGGVPESPTFHMAAYPAG